MSKARDIADLGAVTSRLDTVGASDGALSNRNLIINGAMQVWQRGTSHTTSGGYSADRWWMASATSVARSTEAPEGFTYSAFITASGGGNDSIGQPIELTTGSSSPMVAGQKVTVSLYAKTVSGTDDIAATINFRDAKYSGTNQSAFGSGDTWTVTTTWQRFTTTFTVPLINPTNVLAGLEIFSIGSSMYITGVQLEVGDTATDFEHPRSYGDELARCQRYFQKSAPQSEGLKSISGQVLSRDGTASSVQRYIPVRFVQTMRTTPSVTIYDVALTVGAVTQDGTNGRSAGASIPGDQAMMVYGPSGINHYSTRFGYYLDAEL
jgi:hypothetical protein